MVSVLDCDSHSFLTCLNRFNVLVLLGAHLIHTVSGAKVENPQPIDRRVFSDFMAGEPLLHEPCGQLVNSTQLRSNLRDHSRS